MNYKKIDNYEFIKGDINQTIPEYCKENKHLKKTLLHIDLDAYEPTVTIHDNVYEKVVTGGILMFDDYGAFPGETKAVDEFFDDKDVIVQKLPYPHIPSFVVKN